MSNPFPFLPDWSKGISMKYGFDTVITTGEKSTEQRKSLRNIPYRKESFSLLESDNAPGVNQVLKVYKDSYLDLPIYSEQILVTDTGDLTGKTTLNVGDTSSMFNLWLEQQAEADIYYPQNISLMVWDLASGLFQSVFLLNRAFQFVSLVALSQFAITFTPALSTGSTINGATTVIFPTFKARYLEPAQADETDKLSEIQLDFEEYV